MSLLIHRHNKIMTHGGHMGRNKQTEAEKQLFQSIGKRISQLFEKYDPAASNYDLYRIIYGEEPTTKDNGKNKISALRNGRNITLPVLMAISSRYHVSIDWLVHGYNIKSQGCTVRDVCNAIMAMSAAVDIKSLASNQFNMDKGVLLAISPKSDTYETSPTIPTLNRVGLTFHVWDTLRLNGEGVELKNKQGQVITDFLKDFASKLANNARESELQTLVEVQPTTLIEKGSPDTIDKTSLATSNYTLDKVAHFEI